MWLSVLCGLALGLMLNLGADWLPRRVTLDAVRPGGERPNGGVPESGTSPPSTGRLVRWGALFLLSIGLVLHLRSSGTTGRSSGLPLLAGAVPELIYCSLLLLIATIDLEHRLVPNLLILAGLILAVGFNLLAPLRGVRLWNNVPGLTTALAGAAVGGGLFLLVSLARRNALGAGDVKLATLIGMLTGFPWVLQALVLGIVLGGLAAALLLVLRLRGPKHYIPYAPYLVAGAMATLLCGQHIAHWYARLAGVGG